MSAVREQQGQSTKATRDPGYVLGAIAVICHTVSNAISPFGWQRDEFLYFAMGRHLQLWRMDFPPFIAIASRVSAAVFGQSLVATRVFPSLVHATLIILATRVARALGGGRYAQWLAALALFASPLFMRPGTLFQPVVFDQLWWTLALYGTLKLGLTDDHRWWLVIGAALGLGLLTKFSIAFIALPLALGFLVSPSRRWFRTRWPWIAAAMTLGIGLPSLTGQLLLGMPVAGQMHDLQQNQLAYVTPLAFLGSQVLFSPVFVPLSIVGLVAIARRPATRPVAIACVGAMALLMALRGKPYYVGPIYPTLFGATAAALEAWGAGALKSAVRVGVIALLIVVGMTLAPFGYPVLAPRTMARYAATLGITQAVRTNQGEVLELPQDYADMLGWEELVREVAKVYHALPAEDRRRAVIYGQNYGRAGAVDFFARKYDIPTSVSSAGTYWFFGPGELPGEVLISVGSDHADLDRYFASVEAAAQTTNPMGVPEERSVTIWVCRHPRNGMTLQQLWPQLAGQN